MKPKTGRRGDRLQLREQQVKERKIESESVAVMRCVYLLGAGQIFLGVEDELQAPPRWPSIVRFRDLLNIPTEGRYNKADWLFQNQRVKIE